MEKCITLLLKTMMCPWHSDWRSQAFLLFSSLFPCLGTSLTAAEPFAGGEQLTSRNYTDVSSLDEWGLGWISPMSTNIWGDTRGKKQALLKDAWCQEKMQWVQTRMVCMDLLTDLQTHLDVGVLAKQGGIREPEVPAVPCQDTPVTNSH